jgi:hypothetical protein
MGKGKTLTKDQTDAIRLMAVDEPNREKLARMFGVSRATIYKTLGKVDPEIQREQRHEAMGAIAGRMTGQIRALLDSIENIPANASFQQKAVVLGILSDKLEKIDKRLAESKIEDKFDAIPLPETVEAMLGAIRNEIRVLAPMLQLGLDDKVLAEAKAIEEKTGAKIIDVEYTEIRSIDDIDGGINVTNASPDPKHDNAGT